MHIITVVSSDNKQYFVIDGGGLYSGKVQPYYLEMPTSVNRKLECAAIFYVETKGYSICLYEQTYTFKTGKEVIDFLEKPKLPLLTNIISFIKSLF